ncbi:hypothetical protein RIF25_09445 [Thermosynechococcaceae cyanobacterium BACA0444]|uniref:Uncharacterized protein n=1 Tax=Pseudocalidococcus azoricus BACA0444 TaxID=2918990 RepID=A0AAE4FTI5_9CYAN|nr:hypothetical protein [Pseudocalidococcus azoricus]MDS3861032.1 hypothetical protein [Pseudocalidococcus azoricus BACA0444]
MAVKRYKDFVMLYDLDFNKQVVGRNRIYKEQLNEQIQTPITSLALARTIPTETGDPSIDAPLKLALELTKNSNFVCRYVLCCLENPFNKGGISEFRAIVPYRPTDPFHKAHVRQILGVSNVESGVYHGEEHKTLAKLTAFL